MSITTLQPHAVWHYFAALCAIPRPSHHEEAVQNYVLQEAKRLGLDAERDEAGNIRVRKAGTLNGKTVILQAHLDMVPQKTVASEHDFLNDPIRPVIRDGWVYADGTTLGADNGIGAAMILAILADPKALHPPLEALFTASEETGMTGAKGLQPHWLNGEYLINLDYEEEGELCIGCAGGLDATFTLPFQRSSQTGRICRVDVQGFKGGHSGVDIDKKRGNALKILVDVLKTLKVEALYSLSGGDLRNAIPREASAIFHTHLHPETLSMTLMFLKTDLAAELCEEDADFTIDFEYFDDVERPVLNAEDTARVLQFLDALPNGVIGMSEDFEGLVETSSNLAAIKMDMESLRAHCLLRSSSNEKRHALAEEMRQLAEQYQGSALFEGDYNGWQPVPNSPLLNVLAQEGEALYGHPIPIKMIHAGLECGILSTHYPHWQMIAFGPTIQSPHSPDERVHIDSVTRSMAWLERSLSALGEGAVS